MSSVNLLALPKRKEFLKNFLAPEGWVCIREDVHALEPCVLTHLSQDPNMLKLHGKGAKHHDVYLFIGHSIYQKVKDNYHIDDPTTEMIAKAKDICHEERDKLKPIYLGWIYGLGPNTLSKNQDMPFKEAARVLRRLDYMFGGKDKLHKALISQLARTGGHVISGRGTPVCCFRGKQKDIVNRVVQRTGHDILQRLLYHRNVYRIKHGIEMKPYIPDWHDESLWLVRKHDVERAKEAINYSYEMVNKELNWSVEIRHGGIQVGKDISIRCD